MNSEPLRKGVCARVCVRVCIQVNSNDSIYKADNTSLEGTFKC